VILPFAHGIAGRRDLPIPDWIFAAAASTVLALSFVALAVLWTRPRLQDAPRRRVLALSSGVLRTVEVVCGTVGVLVFAGVLYAGFAGAQVASANPIATFVFVLFWVGLAPLSLLAGDVFRLFNPWRALGRAAGWAAKRAGAGALPEPLAYPGRLGRWPAAVGILAFVWVELIYSGRDDPSALAVLSLAYAAVQLVGMSLYGVEPWTTRADAFAVYFGLFARLSVWERRDDGLYLRPPLAGVFSLPWLPGTVALLCVMIGTTTFDGLSQGALWGGLAPDVQRFFADLGLSLDTALDVTFTLGLLATVALACGVYWVGVAGMRTVETRWSADELAARFSISLIPISLAYVLAHYFSLLAYQGQATAFLASDPLGDGSDLFGTAGSQINYGVVSAAGIWWVQVACLVIGHVAALVLAHERAVADFRAPREATRSQYWMLLVMVAFTCLGLWLLSAANQS